MATNTKQKVPVVDLGPRKITGAIVKGEGGYAIGLFGNINRGAWRPLEDGAETDSSKITAVYFLPEQEVWVKRKGKWVAGDVTLFAGVAEKFGLGALERFIQAEDWESAGQECLKLASGTMVTVGARAHYFWQASKFWRKTPRAAGVDQLFFIVRPYPNEEDVKKVLEATK